MENSTKQIYTVGERSKSIGIAKTFFVLSGIFFFRVLLSNINVTILDLFLVVALVVVLSICRQNKLHFQWVTYCIVAIGLIGLLSNLFFLELQMPLMINLFLICIGIIMIFMAHGFIKSKFLALLLSIFNIVCNIFVLFTLLAPDHNIADEEVRFYSLAIFVTTAFSLLSIGILFVIFSLVSETIAFEKKSPETAQQYIPNTRAIPQSKFCAYCGKEILPQTVICPNCGCVVSASIEPDIPSTGLNVLSFFFPIVGLILYCVHHDKTPNKARQLGKWALIGFCVGMGCSLLFLLLLFI